MTRDDDDDLLRAHKAPLAQQFGVADFALFGSFARDRAGEDSDVDILVRFDGRATSKRFFCTQFYIKDLLGRSVDLVIDSALRRQLHPCSSVMQFMSERERVLRSGASAPRT